MFFCELLANFIDGDQLATRHATHELIDFDRRWDYAGSAAPLVTQFAFDSLDAWQVLLGMQ
jgi:hypothetical protein